MHGKPRPNAACPRCGAAFACAAASYDPPQGAEAFACWCMDLPRIAMPDAPAGCLCPDCLKAEIAERAPPAP